MSDFHRIGRAVGLLVIVFLLIPSPAAGDEMLAPYGLKGYAYTYSPLTVDGFHLQTGAMYSIYHKNNLDCRDGYIWDLPVSLTYGDGKLWEAAAAIQWERWKNTDYDVDERGFGDLFIGGKVRPLAQDRGMPLDLAVMPYILLPTGDRDASIGDLYLFNPSDDDDLSYGLNLLLGRRWDRFYLSVNLGINLVDTDLPYIEEETFLFGMALEYQVSERLNTYLEFLNNENKNRFQCEVCTACDDPDVEEDIREVGLGAVWLAGPWGFKAHIGAGMTETSPDFRLLTLINRSFSF